MSDSVGLDVALSFLRTWRDDRALLRCELRLRGCLAVIVCRVESVRDGEVRLRADDEEAAIVIPLSAASEFLYRDMRDAPDLNEKYDSTLTWLVSYDEAIDGPYELVIFAEMRPTP